MKKSVLGVLGIVLLIACALAIIWGLTTALHNDYLADYNEADNGEQVYSVSSITLDDDRYRVVCENGETYTVSTIQFDPDCDGVYILVEKREEPMNKWQVVAWAFGMESRKRMIYNITLVMGIPE